MHGVVREKNFAPCRAKRKRAFEETMDGFPLCFGVGLATSISFAIRPGRPPICAMGFEQYHEPADELPEKTRTFARMIVSLTEEAEAINWYEQRIALEKDKTARAIMENAQKEEMKHFSMDLEWLLRTKSKWREIAHGVLFTEGDIVKEGDEAEEEAD